MKRTIINSILVIVFFVGLIFFVIYIKGDSGTLLEHFSSVEKEAQVISINDVECIVRLIDSDGVDVSIPVSELGKPDKYKPGDYLVIEYSGGILESAPARFENIISVERKSR